jgi:hypothetical protein
MDWGKYFKTLIDWKKLPSYRLETRIDSIIGYYLPEIVSHYMKVEIIGIIPEFPIRCKTINPNYKAGERSYKADFLLISKENPNYLVEFKTDLSSCKEDQYNYYIAAKEEKLGALIDGIGTLYEAADSKSKKKYKNLIDILENKSLIDDKLKFKGKNEEIKIIYVQPLKNNKDNKEIDIIIDFNQISKWINKKQNIGTFEKELSKALLEWSEKDK